jgi:hypothetical protein
MIPDASGNPFAALSLIVAPAILTNASSVLAMSTSNRLARAVDRARELARQLEEPGRDRGPEADRRLSELTITETRAILLLRVLRSLYTALGGFALATLVSLLGAVLAVVPGRAVVQVLELTGVCAGMVAVGALVHGSVLLLHETRMAVAVLRERAERVRTRIGRGDRL